MNVCKKIIQKTGRFLGLGPALEEKENSVLGKGIVQFTGGKKVIQYS